MGEGDLMVTCSKCKIDKKINLFSKGKSECKKCSSDRNKDWRLSKLGLIATIYNNQKNHSKKRGHRPPEYTKEELTDWLFSQPLFHTLYSEWKGSGYKRRLIPSVDRKHDDIHYCMGNIQLMVFRDNYLKYSYQLLNGETDRGNIKSVVATNMINGDILYFHSVSEGARYCIGEESGNANICKALKGKINSAYGHKWAYQNKKG